MVIDPNESVTDLARSTAISTLPATIAWELDALPLSYEQGTLRVALAVNDVDTVERIRYATRAKHVEVVIRDISEIRDGLHEAYPPESAIEDANILQILQDIIDDAVRAHAADVFIEPANQHGEGQVRLAVDGVLRPSEKYGRLQRQVFVRLTGLIRAQADVQPQNTNLPGDGRCSIQSEGRTNDLRVSTMPVGRYQRVCMRFLSSLLTLRDLRELGMPPAMHNLFRNCIERPGAFVTIAGPTGEGKSTTAYAAIKGLDVEHLNVCSIENPIECYIDGVMQIPIAVEANQASGVAQMTFAQAMRALMRQYPHFIFLGEIRDSETVDIAMQASTTGVSVLSTVHAHDALRTIVRLETLGAQRTQLAQSVTAVVSQRLLRKLCPNCKVPATGISRVAYDLAQTYGVQFGEQIFEAHQAGCRRCKFTGYFDRVGAFEIINFTAEIRDALEAGTGLTEIAHIAVDQGYRPMAVAGLEHVARGETSEAEVRRVTSYDDAITYMRPSKRHPHTRAATGVA